ncbi:MAG: ribosomal-processing cysteine protease Prp [Liquorilactobacillus ghanensis]|uniref:Ribosomal processing cysteine protease Prp n=1 Tax=Liquorilactobacillus ghanensis DSM 18630 TaxID=1423750 RepID=A0A0R1W0H0_9LACO|nr:ribosomal-processing cysteine protease Prp [Liquorilactobacillus ghanensis]KRM07740.1 hypothetical protein FC89_GL000183 [Liquorilactobacillus ghanensis DSM 18630]
MICAVFKGQGKKLSGFELTGHADAGEYGQDIVCAAVSALAISTVNGLERLTGADLAVEQDEQNGGFLAVVLKDPDNSAAQLLLQNLRLALNDVAQTYSDYLKINAE